MRRNNLITIAIFVAIFASAGTGAAFCDDKASAQSQPVVTKPRQGQSGRAGAGIASENRPWEETG